MALQLLDRRRGGLSAVHRANRLSQLVRRLDLVLITAALLLAAIGLVMIYSATRSYADPNAFVKRQLIYGLLGCVAMVVAILVDYRRLEEWAYPIYALSFLALLAVRVLGRANQGAAREITLGPLAIQPSEFAVLSLVIVVAAFISTHEAELDLRLFARLVALAGAPMALVFLEPDLGTTLICAAVFVTMMVIGGIRLRYLGLLVAGIVLVVVVGSDAHLLHGYQVQRLTAFLHQDNCANVSTAQSALCYQLDQAKAAIGAGGFAGTGLLHGAVTYTGFVPYAYADMIFSAVGEQLGFVGSSVVIALFAVLAFRIVRTMQRARDTFGRLLCAGALAFLVFSLFVNVGMNIGIMPITGIPLPFISYGGSALFATFAAVGLVVNVGWRRAGSR